MRILEISETPAAAYAALLLTSYGADVDRIELPDRHPHPEVPDQLAADTFLKRNRQLVDPSDVNPADYEVVIEDIGATALQKLGLSWRQLHAAAPSLVLVSLSPFGQSGPYANWAATDINAQAAGGVVHVSGFEEETPRKLPGDLAAMICGIHGATAAFSTTFGISNGAGEGVHIDISAQDTLMHHWTRHVTDYAYSGMTTVRQARDPDGIHTRHTARARDGWIFIHALRQPWQDVAAFLGLGEFISPDLLEPGAPQPWDDTMKAAFTEAVAQRDRYDWFADAAELGWTFAPVEDPWAVANGPQTTARGSMDEVSVDDRTIKVPGVPVRGMNN